jgi:hypothetical protein
MIRLISGNQAQWLRLKARPGGGAEMLLSGELQVIQVLPQGFLVELGQELTGDGGVVTTDVFDNLTFVHGRRTFLHGNGSGAARAA